jgi:hypothetical protein
MNLEQTDSTAFARIAKVQGLRFRDLDRDQRIFRNGRWQTRQDRYAALLRCLIARMMAPRLRELERRIRNAQGWVAHAGGIAGEHRHVREIWDCLEAVRRENAATLALLKGERRADEVEIVLDVAA